MAQQIHGSGEDGEPIAAIADLLLEAYKLAKTQPETVVRSTIADALLVVARVIAGKVKLESQSPPD